MTPNELRATYLNFFSQKNHAIIPSASLVPENDPTVLFNTAGMQPLVPYLLGEPHPAGQRLVDVQKCVRTGDIDDVGDDTHLTFFEMLGNWSLQDYFKNESIAWSFEFLTKVLKLPLEKLAFTVFAGEDGIPRDEESAKIWMSLGVSEKRIAYFGREDNWWGPAGQTGPCGPDTEIFYWTGSEAAPEVYNPKDKRWVEIWNNVFMQYKKTEDGKYELLPKPNVDTGMGLERVVAIMSHQESVYETIVFQSIIKNIIKSSGIKIEDYNTKIVIKKNVRKIADHIRASVMIVSDGVIPSNKEQGYILRQLIRRSIDSFEMIRDGISSNEISILSVVQTCTNDETLSVYLDISKISRHEIYLIIKKEVEDYLEKRRVSIQNGKKIFDKAMKDLKKEPLQVFDVAEIKTIPDPRLSAEVIFSVRTTYGIPFDLIREIANKENYIYIESDFEEAKKMLEKHKDLSRAGAEQKFAGGLADNSEETTKLHTATHLLQAALRQVLGPHIFQRGSNITAERLRFDFSHPEKVTPEQLIEVEKIVNAAISKKLPVVCEMMEISEAKASGAVGVFEEKYEKLGGKIKVYTIGGQGGESPVSREVCGGPHVENTGNLGCFKILKEEAVSAGVRRIKAVLEASK